VKTDSAVYRTKAFARLAGVTVRTLHHYDAVGLLRPSAHSSSGYRLYREQDLVRLEQITVLKSLGLPLREIARLMTREMPLAETLRRQHHVLTARRCQIDRALEAIANAESSIAAGHPPDVRQFREIVRAMDMANETDWTSAYHSDEAKKNIEARRPLWSPELQARVTREWTALIADVEAALGDDPASPRAQALAGRWRALVNEFTGGDPEIQRGLNRMWSDQHNWPADAGQGFRIRPEVQDFIVKAMNGRGPNSA